jgi:hypothetical protein
MTIKSIEQQQYDDAHKAYWDAYWRKDFIDQVAKNETLLLEMYKLAHAELNHDHTTPSNQKDVFDLAFSMASFYKVYLSNTKTEAHNLTTELEVKKKEAYELLMAKNKKAA